MRFTGRMDIMDSVGEELGFTSDAARVPPVSDPVP